jgi:hypothetical protein
MSWKDDLNNALETRNAKDLRVAQKRHDIEERLATRYADATQIWSTKVVPELEAFVEIVRKRGGDIELVSNTNGRDQLGATVTTKPAGHEDVFFVIRVEVTPDATNATLNATEGRRSLSEGFGQLPQLEDESFVETLLGLMTKIYSNVI